MKNRRTKENTKQHNTCNINCNKVVNNTNVYFTNEEIHLLSKGLKYNLHHKHKMWIETLALEAKRAINQYSETMKKTTIDMQSQKT
jgi:hypothetical protein